MPKRLKKKKVAVLRILFSHKTRTFKSHSPTLLMDIVTNFKNQKTTYKLLFLLKILYNRSSKGTAKVFRPRLRNLS